ALVTDGLGGGPAGDRGVEDVRVLGGRVVAPDGQVRDVGDPGTGLGGQLAHRPVVVQAGHGGEAVLGHVGGVRRGDQGVGVGGVVLLVHAVVLGSAGVDGLALWAEVAAVGLQQVAALHALSARARLHQQGHVGTLEAVV